MSGYGPYEDQSFLSPNDRLRHHVSGAVARGEAEPVLEVPEPRFYVMDLDEGNLADLLRDIAGMLEHAGRLLGVVDDDGGGIIAYAIGDEHAEAIVSALNGGQS